MLIFCAYIYLGSSVAAMLGLIGMAMSRGDRAGWWVVTAGLVWPIAWPVALVFFLRPFSENI